VAGRNRATAMALAIAAQVMAGLTVAGCATQPPTSLSEILREEGATPGTVSPEMVRPDGTLNNGLLPEPWGDTS
jgi:hypothetical protein